MAEHDDNTNRLQIVQHDVNTNRREVILALECPNNTAPERRGRRRGRRPRQRVPRNLLAEYANHFFPVVVIVQAGQDIGETIRALFEDKKHSLESSGLSVEGRIYSAIGEVSSPRINIQGSPTLFEGLHSIVTFSGRYIIRYDGPVQLDWLMMSFRPNDEHFNAVSGYAVGPVIAGCVVQVTVSFAVIANGED